MANKRLKSAAEVAEEQLKAGAKKVQEQLVTVEKAAEKLAKKAKERLPAPADVRAEIPEVRRRLQEATASVTKRKRASKRSAPTPTAAVESAGVTPDESWTVADLRAEAKKRGLTGYSRKSKAELLRELGG
jgi:hypothetical protein